MTRLELLAGYLDSEATEFDKKSGQALFSQDIDFWLLCIEAKKLLKGQDDKNIRTGSS